MIYVIGGEGFVGSGVVRLLNSRGIEYRVITKNNFEEFRGTECDVIINANGNSKKYLSKNEPITDFDLSVRSVAISVHAFRYNSYVMLSSGDVYPRQDTPELTLEDQPFDPSQQSRYGLHQYLAEQLVRACGKPWMIVRMGGFVGPGLRKNAVHDMLTNKPVWLAPQSELQYISTDSAAEIIWELIESNAFNEVFNIGGEGTVNLATLHGKIGSSSLFLENAPCVRYELSLRKLSGAVNSLLPRAEDEISAFVDAVRSGSVHIF